MSTIPASQPRASAVSFGLLRNVAVAVALASIGDWLFYHHAMGISFAIFLTAVCIAVALTNPLNARRSELIAALGIMVLALLPVVEELGVISVLCAVVGTAIFALLVTGHFSRPAAKALADVAWLLLCVPFRLLFDLALFGIEVRRTGSGERAARWMIAWVLPIFAGGIFLFLFTAANPVIEDWLRSIDLASLSRGGDPGRAALWLVCLLFVWPFTYVRPRAFTFQGSLIQQEVAVPDLNVAGPLFGSSAMFRALVLFNLLFAVQTALDIAYLWGGASLPAGMSYASYAHRGAYPLIVTALLAGGFVLAIMHRGSNHERSPMIRALVYLWVAQNVLLVASSIFRLALYVQVYALTGWRVAAFVWMMLIAIGLVLIVARIAFDKPNTWLLWTNGAVLALTLYLCGLFNFAGFVADFNVVHGRVFSGGSQSIHLCYLCTLGPDAIPAIDGLEAKLTSAGWAIPHELVVCRARLEDNLVDRVSRWRAWSFRAYRLERLLQRRDGRAADAALLYKPH